MHTAWVLKIIIGEQGFLYSSDGYKNNAMVYILGTLFAILLLLCIGVLLKKLLGREVKSA